MKRILLAIIAITFYSLSGLSQIKMPAPSSTQTIKQEFGMGAIELTYSRPNAKGRKIYGDLVPYNKLWRTGANASTKIVFNDVVELGGKKVDTGTYVLYTIPGVDSWEIILNKGLTNWGTDGYKESEDVFHVKVEPTKMNSKVETFTMQFVNIKPESCELQLIWEKTMVSIPITTNIKDRLRAQIEAAIQTEKKPYWQAAQFYKEYDNNLTKSLDNINKALETNEKAYYMWLFKARIQNELGDKAGAKISANKSLLLAKELKNEDYIKLNEDLLKKLK